MFSSVVRNFVLFYAAIKSLFSGIGAAIGLLFKKTYLRIPMFFILFIMTIWAIGFSVYYYDIDQNWERIKIKNPKISQKTDAIVVLTGGSERIRNAIHLLNQEYGRLLFISGVNKKVKLPELFAIHDVSKEDFFKLINKVEVGFEAKNTLENAIEISQWVEKNKDVKSLRLVTSNYHIRRAMLEVRSKIPQNIEIIPHPVIPINVRIDKWWQFSGTRDLLIKEYNKLIASYFRIYFEKL